MLRNPVFDDSPQRGPLRFPNATTNLWNDSPIGPHTEQRLENFGPVSVKCTRQCINLLSKSIVLEMDTANENAIYIGGYFCGKANIGLEENCFELVFNRFDPGINDGEHVLPSANIPGCFISPIYVVKSLSDVTDLYAESIHSKSEQIVEYLQQQRQISVDGNRIVHVQFYLIVNDSVDYEENFKLFSIGTILDGNICSTPVRPVPIIPTALVKCLCDETVSAKPDAAMGFLTMDHTRKLLLVLDSDPKVNQMPIIGIWTKGVESIDHPLAWQACLNYAHSRKIKQRIFTQNGEFLVLMFAAAGNKPSFYKCRLTNFKDSGLQLLKTNTFNLPLINPSSHSLTMELHSCKNSIANNLPLSYCNLILQTICPNFRNDALHGKRSPLKSPNRVAARSYLSVSNHQQPSIAPTVPEPSMLFEEGQRIEPTPVRNQHINNDSVGSTNLLQTPSVCHDLSQSQNSNFPRAFRAKKTNHLEQCQSAPVSPCGSYKLRKGSYQHNDTVTSDHLVQNSDHLLQDAYKVIAKQELRIKQLQFQVNHLIEEHTVVTKNSVDQCCQTLDLEEITSKKTIDSGTQTFPIEAELNSKPQENIQTNGRLDLIKEEGEFCEEKNASSSLCDKEGINTEQSIHIDSSAMPEPSNEQSLTSSLIAVDMPLLEDSGEDRSLESKDWYPESPMFGESASTCAAPHKEAGTGSEDNGFVGALVEQVHQILCNVSQDNGGKKQEDSYSGNDSSDVAPIIYMPEYQQTRLIRSVNWSTLVKSRSCTELSMHANAIAQKYLTDDQLRDIVSKHSVMDTTVSSMPSKETDKSSLLPGPLSPCNMSLATKKYLEKYGLLNASNMSVISESASSIPEQIPVVEDQPPNLIPTESFGVSQAKPHGPSVVHHRDEKQEIKAPSSTKSVASDKSASSQNMTWSQLKKQLGDSQHMLAPFLEDLHIPNLGSETSGSDKSRPSSENLTSLQAEKVMAQRRNSHRDASKKEAGDTIAQILQPGILETLNHEAKRLKKQQGSHKSSKTDSNDRENMSIRSVPTVHVTSNSRERSNSLDRILSSQVLDLLAERQTRRMSSSPRMARRGGATSMR